MLPGGSDRRGGEDRLNSVLTDIAHDKHMICCGRPIWARGVVFILPQLNIK